MANVHGCAGVGISGGTTQETGTGGKDKPVATAFHVLSVSCLCQAVVYVTLHALTTPSLSADSSLKYENHKSYSQRTETNYSNN